MIAAPLPVGDVRAALVDLDAAWKSRFGDLAKDALTLADVAALLADLGVPDAALAAELFRVLAVLIPMARAAAANGTAAPRRGPPITEADWSHGFPKAQRVDNPSGAIGGGGNNASGA